MARSPLTLTRPSAINSSQARRLPRPTRANTFCSRWPSASPSAAASSGEPAFPSGIGARAQALLEFLHGVGPGQEILHRWELFESGQSQLLQKGRGGAV